MLQQEYISSTRPCLNSSNMDVCVALKTKPKTRTTNKPLTQQAVYKEAVAPLFFV